MHTPQLILPTLLRDSGYHHPICPRRGQGLGVGRHLPEQWQGQGWAPPPLLPPGCFSCPEPEGIQCVHPSCISLCCASTKVDRGPYLGLTPQSLLGWSLAFTTTTPGSPAHTPPLSMPRGLGCRKLELSPDHNFLFEGDRNRRKPPPLGGGKGICH